MVLYTLVLSLLHAGIFNICVYEQRDKLVVCKIGTFIIQRFGLLCRASKQRSMGFP